MRVPHRRRGSSSSGRSPGRVGGAIGTVLVVLFGMLSDTAPVGAAPPERASGAGSIDMASTVISLRLAGVEDRVAVEEDLAWLANQRRAEAGLAPLMLAPAVVPAARRWAEAQAAAGKISHRGDLSPYPDSVPGLSWALTGENVGHSGSAKSSGPSVMTALDQAFYDSPKHRDNVLGPFTHIAVGATDDGSDLFVTVAFVDWKGAPVEGERLPESSLHDTLAKLDALRGVEGGVSVVGWASDADGGPKLQATLRGESSTLTPNVTRPDLEAIVGVEVDLRNGVEQLVPAAPGPVNVCIDSPAQGFGVGVDLGCRDITVPQGWDGLVGSGSGANAMSFAATGLLPGDGEPLALAPPVDHASPATENPATENSATENPATENPAGALPSRLWAGRYPASLQRYPNAAGDVAPSLVYADPFGRLHWQQPDGAAVAARPPGGVLAPGRASVDIGDLNGNGTDDLVVLVREGTGWAVTGFENADPSKPLPVTPRPELDGFVDVQVSVLPSTVAGSSTPDPDVDGSATPGEARPPTDPLATDRLALAGRTVGDAQPHAMLGDGPLFQLGASVPGDSPVDVELMNIEWVDVDGDGAPDAVMSSPDKAEGTCEVLLLTAAGLYQRVDDTVTLPGSPIDLEPR